MGFFNFMDGLFGIFSYTLLAGIFIQLIVAARAKKIFSAIMPLCSIACSLYWTHAPAGLGLSIERLQSVELRVVPYTFMTAAFLVTPVLFRLTGRKKKRKNVR